jgi:hypothetical protein
MNSWGNLPFHEPFPDLFIAIVGIVFKEQIPFMPFNYNRISVSLPAGFERRGR